MDAIHGFVWEEAVDDDDIRYLKLDGFDAGRLEKETRVGSKVALLEGPNEPVDILARIRDIPDGVKGVGRCLGRRPVRLFVRVESKDLPLHLWKLALKHLLTEN